MRGGRALQVARRKKRRPVVGMRIARLVQQPQLGLSQRLDPSDVARQLAVVVAHQRARRCVADTPQAHHLGRGTR